MKKNYNFRYPVTIIHTFFLLVLMGLTVRSAAATAVSAPVILMHPYDRTTCENANTYFAIKALDVDNYLWQVSRDGGITWETATGGIYTGEDTDTLKLTGAYLSALYRCLVEGGGVKDTSATAKLNFFIVEQTVVAKATQLCQGDSTTLVLGSSQTGINYYVKAGGSFKGPYAGTGGPLSMNTGPVLTSANYSVLAQKSAVGNALSFDGIDDYVVVNSGYSAVANFTLSMFVYPNDVNGGKIFSSDVLELGLNAGGIELKASGVGTISYNSIAKDAWSHVAATFDGAALRLYINGTEVNVVAAAGSLEASTTMAIGRDYQTSCCYFNGKIDEFRVRRKSLSATEVKESMTDCITGMESDVIAYYRFDDGSGSPVLSDLSGHGYHGGLTNMNNTIAWVVGTSACGDNLACSRVMLQTPKITVSSLVPVITAQTPASLCDKGVAVLSVVASAGKISWFTSLTGGTELATGSSFTTPLLTSTTSYFVSSTEMGCTSKRTEVVATVNPLPNVNVTVSDPMITAIDQLGGTYQWLDCKKELQAIAGATGIAYSPTVTGTYAVEITLKGCKDTSKCLAVTVTGIEDIANQHTLVVFPNPSTDAFTVRSTNAGIYTIINEIGQTVGVLQLTASNNYTARVEGLKNGMYLLIDLNQQQLKQKIVITK
jgi:hypothetical protein